MKKDDLILERIYTNAISKLSNSLTGDNERDDATETFQRHHVCKDIKGIKALLADIEEVFCLNDEDSGVSGIDANKLHDHIVDRLNDGVCDKYTSHYIYNNILSHPELTPEHILHALWSH